MAGPVRLTERDIAGLVSAALRGEGPIDELVSRALWAGDDPPRRWGEWPEEARQLWSDAVRRYREFRQRTDAQAQPDGERRTSLSRSWDVVLSLAPSKGEWWVLPGIQWRDIASALGPSVSARSAAYRFRILGWRFSGRTVTLRRSDRDAGSAHPRARPSPSQRRVLDAIEELSSATGRAPSLADLSAHLGYRTVSASHYHVRSLIEMGWLSPTGRRVTLAPCEGCGRRWPPADYPTPRIAHCCVGGWSGRSA